MATIKKTAAGTYMAIIRRPRFGVRYKAKTFRRRYDAEGWARKVESEIERGIWRDAGDAEHVTLDAALERYAHEESPRHRGKDIEQATIRVMRDEPICRQALSRIDAGQIRSLRDDWINRGYAVGTVNRRLTILGALYNLARKEWGMPALINPVQGMLLKGANRRERRVSDAEINAIISASGSDALETLIHLAVETAMRRGELCQLTWPMIDLAAGVANLPKEITKNGRARDVPLSPNASAILESQPKQSDSLIIGMEPHSVTQAMRRACARARRKYTDACEESGQHADPHFCKDVHFHDLRHEATSRLAEIFALHELMKITGHRSSKMLASYYHPSAADFAARMRERVTHKNQAVSY